MTSDYWSAAAVLERQKTEPVFLTDCNTYSILDTKTGLAVFTALNLQHGWSDIHNRVTAGSRPEGVTFYPLLPEELEFIGEDCTKGPYGGAGLAFTALYQGRKYFSPTVEVCFDGPKRPFSIESYGDDDSIYPDKATAWKEACRLAGHLRGPLLYIEGYSFVMEDLECDRHGVLLLIPVLFALKRGNYKSYKSWVSWLFRGYRSTPSDIGG